MTSGVYELKFGNDSYIGKSIDIEARWKQHYDKLHKGTSARPMQEAYARNGIFSPSILYKCHEDHIDLMESFFIARAKPTLNTSRPVDPFNGLLNEDLDVVVAWLDRSTVELAHTLNIQNNVLEKYRSQEKGKDDLINALKTVRSDKELDRALGRELKEVRKELLQATSRADSAINELECERKVTWWQKLFN
jgi:hypothetical protein